MEKHLKDEFKKALKKEVITVQSETSTALSDFSVNELEAFRSIKLKDLEEKRKDLVNFVPLLVLMPLKDVKYHIFPLNAGNFVLEMPKCPTFAVSFRE